MFDLMTDKSDSAISILKADHKKVKALFEEFEEAEGLREKKKIVAQALMELKIHAAVEEEIFYPAVRKAVGKEVMTEANEEHHVAKVLIAELEEMNGKEEHYDAKFKVLAENIRHHIREEEGEMMPLAKESPVDMQELGEQIMSRKEEIKKAGPDPFAEAKMVAGAKGKGDSPAAAAVKSNGQKSRQKSA